MQSYAPDMTTHSAGDAETALASRTVRVRCHELAPIIGDLSGNFGLIKDAIVDAVSEGIELLVLPELATSGYYFQNKDEARSCAISIGHHVFQEWADLLAPGMALVVGFCEDRGGEPHNSAAILSSDGLLAVYRKIHLWDEEKNIFAAGAEQPPVIDTPVGRLGVLICYDLEFPEMPRSLAVNGAEIIAVPTNWPLAPRPSGERPPEVIQAMAAARCSTVAIACCDRSGAERGNEWTQGTTIIGTDGWPRGAKRPCGELDAEIEISGNRSRISPLNDSLKDRRTQFYEGLVARV